MTNREPSGRQQAGRITDARGRIVSQLDPVMMQLLRQPGIIPPDALQQIASDVGPRLFRATRLAFYSSIVSLFCFGIAVVICALRFADGRLSTAKFMRSMIPYVCAVCGLFVSWVSLRGARHRQIGNTMLQHRRCPHCGYDIRGLPADPRDGATVCPECGCAWNLNEIEVTEEQEEDGGE